MTTAHNLLAEIRAEEARQKMLGASIIGNLRARLDSIGADAIISEMVGVGQQRQALTEVFGEAVDQVATRVAQRAAANADDPMAKLMEFETRNSGSRMKPVVAGSWSVNQVSTLMPSGKQLLRYVVAGPTGELSDRFRHRTVAEMVAAALTQTNGKLPDQRIDKIRALCEEENAAMSQIANAKRLLEGIDPENRKRADVQKTVLEEAKRRLVDIRRRLGV